MREAFRLHAQYTSTDGTLASFYKLPAHLCYKLPDSLPFDEGAVVSSLGVALFLTIQIRCSNRMDIQQIEPLAVAVHALTQVARIQPNMSALRQVWSVKEIHTHWNVSLTDVLVFGAGPVGLLVMATAKAMAARKGAPQRHRSVLFDKD